MSEAEFLNGNRKVAHITEAQDNTKDPKKAFNKPSRYLIDYKLNIFLNLK